MEENYYQDRGCRRATAWLKARCHACGLCPGVSTSRCLECPFPECLERPARAASSHINTNVGQGVRKRETVPL
jgi:hypothetical protein